MNTDWCAIAGRKIQRVPDETFGLILSNICLHNICGKPTRFQACHEIACVLRPGGTVILSDYKLTAEYLRILKEAGLHRSVKKICWCTTFPPLTMVSARKPHETIFLPVRSKPDPKMRVAVAYAGLPEEGLNEQDRST